MGRAATTGAVSGAGQGAAAGTAIMPGWGTAIGAVAGGIGGYLGGMGDDDASKELQDAIEAANKANQAQYQNLLQTGDQQRLDQTGALNGQYGQLFNMNEANTAASRATIDAEHQKLLDADKGLVLDPSIARNNRNTLANIASGNQSAASRGIYNSSVAANMEGNARRMGQEAEQDIYNNDALRKVGYQSDYSNQILGNETTGQDRALGLRQTYSDMLQNVLSKSYATKLGTMASVENTGPNMSAYANLLSQSRANPYTAAITGGANLANLWATQDARRKPAATASPTKQPWVITDG